MTESLGVDVGGVIIDRINDGTDTSFFSDNYLNTTAVTGVHQALKRLVNERFGSNVHIVSKCGKRIEDKTRHWLMHHNFYEQTGISEKNVHFCRERRDKAPICERLKITHFIDDKIEVLNYLTTVNTKIAFSPSKAEVLSSSNFTGIILLTWGDVCRFLLDKHTSNSAI